MSRLAWGGDENPFLWALLGVLSLEAGQPSESQGERVEDSPFLDALLGLQALRLRLEAALPPAPSSAPEPVVPPPADLLR